MGSVSGFCLLMLDVGSFALGDCTKIPLKRFLLYLSLWLTVIRMIAARIVRDLDLLEV